MIDRTKTFVSAEPSMTVVGAHSCHLSKISSGRPAAHLWESRWEWMPNKRLKLAALSC